MKNKKEMNNGPKRRIEDMSMKEIFDEIDTRNKESIKSKVWKVVKGILLFGPKMLGAMFGLDKETLRSYSKQGTRGSRDYDNYVPHPPSSAQTFRESYKKPFNPYDYDMANQRLYYESIDGKGDSQDHDCHCDHDDR